MNIPSLLFSPNGRLGVRDFYRGAILLTGFWIISQVLMTYGPPLVEMTLALFTLASVYCYLCVYGKRLHDSGRSAWYFVIFLIAYVIVYAIVVDVATRIIAPEALEIRAEMEYLMKRGGWLEAMETHGIEYNRLTIIPQMLGLLVGNAVLALIAGRFRSDPLRNAHGEPTSTGDPML